MATLIDHMILELDLDPKKFDESIKKQAESWLKLRKQSEETRQKVGEHTDKLAQGFSTLATKVTALVAAFFTAEKIARFTANVVKTSVSMGNLSAVTGISIETLSKWELTARRAGAETGAMSRTIANLDRDLKARMIGDAGDNIAMVTKALNDLGEHIELFEANGDARKATDVLMDIVKAMDRLHMDTGRRSAFLQALGVTDPAIIKILNDGHENLEKMLSEQKDFLVLTKDNEDEARKLWQLWEELSQSAESIGRRITLGLFGPFSKIVDEREANQKLYESGGLTRGLNDMGYGGVPLPGLDDNALPKGAKPRSYDSGEHSTSNLSVGQPSGTETLSALGISPSQWDAFRQGVANIESSGGNYGLMGGAGNKYAGAYQLNREEIGRAAKALGEQIPSTQAFLKDRAMQERYFDYVTRANHEFLMKYSQQYQNMGPLDRLKMLGYAHNQGPTGARRYLETGRVGSDAFGTPGTKYIEEIGRQLRNSKADDNTNTVFDKGAPPLPILANPRLLRAPRFNLPIGQAGGNYSTSETTVHSLIVNGINKPLTDDAYGLAGDAIQSLERGEYMNQITEGPN